MKKEQNCQNVNNKISIHKKNKVRNVVYLFSSIIKQAFLFSLVFSLSGALFLSCLRTADYTSNPHISEAERLEGGSGNTPSNGNVAVTSISLDLGATGIVVGGDKQLTATILPATATNSAVTWASSDTNIATVSPTGLVSAVSAGTATITVTTTDGGFTATSTITVTTAPVAATGVSVTPATASVQAGNTTQLTAAISPTNATNSAVSWASSDTNIATVTATGLVSAVSAGTATITVTTTDGGFTAQSTITVTAAPIAVTGVSVTPTTGSIQVGSTTQLNAAISPTNATNSAVTWTTTNAAVATVNATGLVSAVSAGSATITVTTTDGGFTATSIITVTPAPIAVTGVSVTPGQATLGTTPAQSIQLTANVVPTNATDKTVTWTTSDATVATVTATGLVTAVSVGSVEIKVITTDGSKSAVSEITVTNHSPEVMVAVIPATYSMPAAGIKFPISNRGSADYSPSNFTNDNGSAVIKHKFALAQTEVTYKLWKDVFDWAKKDSDPCEASGKHCYQFVAASPSAGGKFVYNNASSYNWLALTPTDDKQPVTNITWRNAIVWCNAYTQWSNAKKGTNYTVVYKSGGSILRDATGSGTNTVENKVGTAFNPTTNTGTGFRLPTSIEWEFAARLRKNASNAVAGGIPSGVTYPINIGGTNYWFTKGNSASGADQGASTSSGNSQTTADTYTNKYAWNIYNTIVSGSTTSPPLISKTKKVATKTATCGPSDCNANALGLYDMSGNVSEWVFDVYKSGYRTIRGGSFTDNRVNLTVGWTKSERPYENHYTIGFRPARTIP